MQYFVTNRNFIDDSTKVSKHLAIAATVKRENNIKLLMYKNRIKKQTIGIRMYMHISSYIYNGY